MSTKLFDLETRKSFRRARNLTVRVPTPQRQKLELIASQEHWQISGMVNKMILNYIEEYDKLPKQKQSSFDLVG